METDEVGVVVVVGTEDVAVEAWVGWGTGCGIGVVALVDKGCSNVGAALVGMEDGSRGNREVKVGIVVVGMGS